MQKFDPNPTPPQPVRAAQAAALAQAVQAAAPTQAPHALDAAVKQLAKLPILGPALWLYAKDPEKKTLFLADIDARIGMFEPSGPYAVSREILDYRHPDLQPNIDASFIADPDNVPQENFSNHATLVAGVIVAARNGEGSVGVAYDAKIAGFQIGDTISATSPVSAVADFAALTKYQDYDVVNNSWGFAGNFENFTVATPPLATEFFQPAVVLGREGLGTNIIMAGGNSRQTGGNTNYSETTNNRFVIVTGAINAQADISTLSISSVPFSNPGASILISVAGSSVAPTARTLTNEQGSVFGSDTDTVQGTSFATPIVSRVSTQWNDARRRHCNRLLKRRWAVSRTHQRCWRDYGRRMACTNGFQSIKYFEFLRRSL